MKNKTTEKESGVKMSFQIVEDALYYLDQCQNFLKKVKNPNLKK